MSIVALMAKAAGEPITGARRGSKGSSKGKGKASAGHESEIVSRLSTLCTIAAKIITVLTRYRPIVLELKKNCNDSNFPRRRVFGIYSKL